MISDICSAERRFNFRANVLRPTALFALSAAGIAPLAFAQAPTPEAQKTSARQEAAPQQDASTEQGQPEEVVITGTNIVRNGFAAPTPLTALWKGIG